MSNNLTSSNSKIETNVYLSKPKVHRTIAGKDDLKGDKEIVSKQKKHKDASGTKKIKSLLTKKPKLKLSEKEKAQKSRKPKLSKRNGKIASHPKSKSEKILNHLKPQTKRDDLLHSASIKDRIIEVYIVLTEMLILSELLSSLLLLLGSIVLAVFGLSALPYFLMSAAAFASTFPGALVLFKYKAEHGIFIYAAGQLVFAFIELFWIAVIWFDSANYNSEIIAATYSLEGLVIYQFIVAILSSWQPYREVNPKKFAKKCKDSVKAKLKCNKKQSKATKNQKNLDSESSILSFEVDNLPKNKQFKQAGIWEICSDKLVTPNVRPTSSKDMSSTDVNTTSGKNKENPQKTKTLSNQLQGNKEKRPVAINNNGYTVSMLSTPETTSQNRDDHVAFHLPNSSKPSSGTSLDNALHHTPSDAGSFNATFAGVTPLQELPQTEPKQATSNSSSGSVYASSHLPTEGGSGNSETNVVTWKTGKCWNYFQNATKVCGEGGIKLKGERLNIERYVGAACNCDENSLGFDGFNCPIQCDRKLHSKMMTECRQEHRECQIGRKTNEPFCGCPIGYAYKKVSGGKSNCQKVDSCQTCEHKCHKASACLPGTSGSRTGYNCAPCDPKLGYRGDGFSCENIDECSDDRLNACDKPNAYCDDRDPVYDDGLKYECTCQEGWMGDPKGGYKWKPCKDTNECLNATVCDKNSICVNTPGSFICQCKEGYRKKAGSPRECEDINECEQPRPCHQLAYCKNTPGTYECKCREGYKGDGKKECLPDKDFWCSKCDKETTDCVLSEKKDTYVCKCKSGFQAIPGNTNRCEDIPNCRDPTLNDCDKTPGRATCTDIPGSFYCNCSKNYEGNGKVCKPSDPCEISYPCSTISGTVCFNNNGKAECRCKEGFVRQLKDQANLTAPCFDINSAPVNNCTICDNATTICQSISKDLPFKECICRDGYIRNAAGKCVNVNECQKASDNNCDDQAICIDRQPALHGKKFECECKKGFSGIGTIDNCEDHNECKNETLNACPNPVTICVNTVGSFKCNCKEGYRKLKGREECSNINECDDGTAVCPLMSKCVDLSPGYKCICNNGFRNTTKDGKMVCEDINECLENEGVGPNKSPACDNVNGICKNTLGSFLCDCKKGFLLSYDGKSCIDIDECKSGAATCNSAIEDCQNTVGSYKCNCRYGFIPNPKTGKCEDRNECLDGSNKCNQHSTCVNTFASYKCLCEEGFQPKVGAHPLRPVCERAPVCEKQPRICEPGRCENTEVAPHFYKCHCPASAVILNDTKCVFPNYCDKDFPCPKSAVCVGNQCICNVGYSWQEISRFPITIDALRNRPPCKEVNPCLEQQLCVPPLKCHHTGPGQHACKCQQGFELIDGECFDINECEIKEGAAKCPVNSKCQNLVGSFKCECALGYVAKTGSTRTSPNCIDVNECDSGTHDCAKKNATCINTIGSYDCKCTEPAYRAQAPDYQICRDVNECKEGTHICAKDTSYCTNTEGGYDCKCKDGYFGDGETCIDIDECNPADPKHNCTNTQECINMPGTFNCTCLPGYQLTANGCEDINECLSLENNNCSKIGGEVRMKCINEPGSYSCVCPSGYAQISSEKCKDINECQQLPKVCPAFDADICINTNGSFDCGCKQGFAKSKRCTDKTKCPCEDINECLVGTHVNGKLGAACGPSAKCENVLGSHRCSCADGYEGNPYKEGCKIADACKVKNPCDKETEDCVSAKEKAVCVCKKGFLITNNKKCQKNPCIVNRGGCGKSALCVPIREEEIIKPVCKCRPGEKLNSDKECEKIDQCECKTPVPLGNPCHSKVRCSAEHMLCVNYGHDANCTCESGFKLSENRDACNNINECKEGVNANPKNLACDPQAKCTDTIGSWSCDCPRGQRVNHEHKCVVDSDCTKEIGCKHDPNAYCKSVNASHMWCECKNNFVGTGLARDGLCQPENHCVAAKRAANGKEVCPPNEHCVNEPEKLKCRCNKGFRRDLKTGKCEDVDECRLGIHECRPTYTCKNTIGSFMCHCPLGYLENKTDSRCDDINECDSNKPLHNCTLPKERCMNLPGTFKCECASPAYVMTIRGCQDNNECDTNQFECPEFSTCNNTVGGYQCPCNKGFKAVVKDGKTIKCEDIDECQSPNACPKHSTCKNLIGTFECKCLPPTIQHGLQDCVANATCPECHKNAVCLKSTRENGDVYNCTCAPGFRGDGIKTCDPIDECAEGTAKCHKLAKCIDETPLYRCECNEPFEGDGKNVCNLVDLCKKYNDCPANTKCVPLDNKVEDKWVTCVCPKGFVFNNKTRQCDDIDECKREGKEYPCPSKPDGVKCVNTQGSYSCICPTGFKLGGPQMSVCDDVDECLDTGSVICSKQGAKCINTVGSFACSCPKGMLLGKDNQTCSDIDECKEGKDDCDKDTSTCRNTIGSFACDCKKGLAKIPTKTNKCEDINECTLQLHNCKPYSELCHNTFGGFKCNCSNGYIKKEDACVPASDCDKPIECGANAFCVMRASRKDPSKKISTCVCQDGYYGVDPTKYCDPVPDCEKDLQCPTNARCIETQVTNTKGRATFICECDTGYRKKGSQCEPINECLENENICNGTAICTDLTPGFKCECPAENINIGIGKNNVTCTVPKCSDLKSPCHADAECIDNAFGFSCRCKKGFRGVGTAQLGCEVIDQCKEYVPCSQYATCVNQPRGSTTCTCKQGYEGNGTICHDINECNNPKACDINAHCVNTQGSYNCRCNDGWAGTGQPGFCSDQDECADPKANNCDLESTTCVNTPGSFDCLCKKGYERSSGSNRTCLDINECSNNTKPVCGEHKCTNLPGTYTCVCNAGYTLSADGHSCPDLNECDTNPCNAKASCTNTPGSYSCVCNEGYTGNGKDCSPIDKCSKPELNSCEKSTTVCKQIEHSAQYRCECKIGYIPPPNVTAIYFSCNEEDECQTGKAKYDPLTQICTNTVGSYKITCKPGFEEDPKDATRCKDKNECSEDPAFEETIKIFLEAKKEKKALGDWKKWMIKPKNESSAYGLCYNKAIEKDYWWFTSSSSPLPFCRNTAYNPAGAFNGNRHVTQWKGFECDCQPGNKRQESISVVRVLLTCDVEDPCESLACDKLGEGWICDKKQARCVCDASQGYAERISEHSFCTRDECTKADVNGPMTVANIQHRSMIKCNYETKKWIPVKGYDFVRNGSNLVIGLKDIDECQDENYCCNRKKAQCSSHGGSNSCKMQCENFDGGAACYCDTKKMDVDINRDTCQCIPKCAVNSAWYLSCDGSEVKCNTNIFQKLSEASTAPKGSICSRLVDENGKYITFSNIMEMIKEICDKKFYCIQSPEVLDDIRKHPAFNYEGQCIAHKDQIDKVKCPFGEKPEIVEAFTDGAFCPFKIDHSKWPPLSPEYQKRDGVSMPLNCLPNGMKLNKNVAFIRDSTRYTMEAI